MLRLKSLTGVLELPIAEVRLQPFIAEFGAHYGGQQGFPQNMLHTVARSGSGRRG